MKSNKKAILMYGVPAIVIALVLGKMIWTVIEAKDYAFKKSGGEVLLFEEFTTKKFDEGAKKIIVDSYQQTNMKNVIRESASKNWVGIYLVDKDKPVVKFHLFDNKRDKLLMVCIKETETNFNCQKNP